MRLLTLQTVSFNCMQERMDRISVGRYSGSISMFFQEPENLLKAMTADRMQIIRLLRDEGPMTAETIAAYLERDKVMVRRDLKALLDFEIIDLERDAQYLFEFDGIEIRLQLAALPERMRDHN